MAISTEVQKCGIEGCKAAYRAKGYCTSHYRKWRQGEFGKTRYKHCVTEGCLKRRYQHGLCEAHYKEQYISEAAAAAPAEPQKEEKAE